MSQFLKDSCLCRVEEPPINPEGVGAIQPPLAIPKETRMTQVIEMTTATLTQEMAKGPTIVDFWAPWCRPCVAINVELEKLKVIRPNINIIKVNVDEHPRLVKEYGIKSVPCVIYTNGATSSPKSFNGFITAEDMIRRIGA